MLIDYQVLIILISTLITLVGTVFFINKIAPIALYPIKYPEIDGIRGYLAFFVFLHHSYIWNYFLKTDSWIEPSSNLFNHFGQTSVVIFFIITAFLFTNKLLESKNKDYNWNKYLVSRFLRMFPMYITSILIVFTIVAFYSHFSLKTNIFELLKNILSWIFFTINGPSDINNFKNTYLINAGVSWTLPYEWMFYFLLPFIALLFKIKVSKKTLLVFGLGFLVFAIINKASLKHFLPFIGGILVSIYTQKNNQNLDYKKSYISVLLVFLLILMIVFFESGRKPIPVLISSILFLSIAKGNSFFGLFSNSLSRKFGQISYSLYLIHGIVLFLIFNGIIGIEYAKKLTQFQFWSIITLSIIPIVFISQITYLYIEKPFMNILKK